MKIEFAAGVSIGIRPSNDDRAMVLDQILDDPERYCEMGETTALAVVCDGCGGYAGGGIAAQTVLEELISHAPSELLDEDALMQALQDAEQAVLDAKKEDPALRNMCTTVVGCVFGAEKTLIFHSGDSRLYRYDGNYLAKLTVDHSGVQQQVDAGIITAEEARTSPSRSIITRCMGMDLLPPDIRSTGPIRPGEIWLLCSDGLWERLTDTCLQEVLGRPISLQEKADLLIQMALDAGSDDNITVCLCAGQGKPLRIQQSAYVMD